MVLGNVNLDLERLQVDSSSPKKEEATSIINLSEPWGDDKAPLNPPAVKRKSQEVEEADPLLQEAKWKTVI